MAVHKAKVIGAFAVCGVDPGGVASIDDEQVNLAALLSAQLVELVAEKSQSKKRQKPTETKGDD